MKIGELAKQLGCPVATIRFWEREGLLPAPSRTEGNYRTYTDTDLERMLFIRNCRTLDMGLDEVRQLLCIRNMPSDECSNVNVLVDTHIERVVTKIEHLRALEVQLRSLRQRCGDGRAIEQCGILQTLGDGKLDVDSGAETPAHKTSASRSSRR